jgi:hypothetical protein
MLDIKRWILPITVAIVAGGIVIPVFVARHHDSIVQDNQNAAVGALQEFVRLQAQYFDKNKRYATSFEDLGGEWAAVQDLLSRNPTDFNGYRFRMFVTPADKNGAGYAIMAVPASYGYTGRFTFFLSAPGKPVYYYDFGVKTDTASRQVGEYFVPKGARALELD